MTNRCLVHGGLKVKRGRGAYGKTIVFGIFQRNGHVYTEIVPDCSKATLQAVIRGKVELESIIYSGDWRGYNGLAPCPGTQRLLETILSRENMQAVYQRVVSNKGAAGIDGMTVGELGDHFRHNWPCIREQLLVGEYRPQAVRKVEIPKALGGHAQPRDTHGSRPTHPEGHASTADADLRTALL